MRIALLVAGLATAAVAVSACGEDSNSPGSPGSRSEPDDALEGALKFARCMRENGVDIPDPKSNGKGLVQIGPGPGGEGGRRPNMNSATFRKAERACRKHLESGGAPPDDAKLAEHRDAFVAYARCMRGEGIDVPDPTTERGGLTFRVGGGPGDGPNPESPVFKKADAACHKHLAKVDADMEKAR